MNRLYLVRHGENRANITKEFSHKQVDYSLTDKGVLQAQQTAAYFKTRDIHEIYASPLKRAGETAEIIAASLKLPVTIIENFREVNPGILESQPPTPENWAIYHRITVDWLNGKPESSFPGGENYFMLWDRVRTGLEQIVAGKHGRNILIVGHGGVFTYVLKDLCPNSNAAWQGNSPNHNCSITEIMVEAKNGHLAGKLITWAAYDHLTGAAANLVSGIPQDGELEDGQKDQKSPQ
ncbi:MAG: histidine phosphatase family protein [Anaerolineae bacterium]|nr:histidine phosphatase family protein [Anaerolineae bacterium]